MNQRSTFWLAAAGLFAATLALGVGFVAIVRADDSSSTTGGMGMGMGMSMSGSQPMMDHMAPAPMDGVPDATASRGGQPLEHSVENGVWIFSLEAKPVRWEILSDTRVTAWT